MPRRPRAKKFAPTPIIDNEIRGRLNADESPADIRLALITRYPRLNQRLIGPEIRKVQAQIASVEALAGYNRGSFINIQEKAGCAEGATVRIGFNVQWIDPETGRGHSRDVSVDLTGCKRWGQCLGAAVAEVRRVQARKGPQSPKLPPDSALKYGTNLLVIPTYMECR